MNTKIMRRPYAAPNAELICLVPSAPIANWKWPDSSANTKWDQNRWGGPTGILNELASATGIAEWAVDELESD